jgi:hypothetical protein
MDMLLSFNADFTHVEMESTLSFQRTIIFGISLSVHGVGNPPLPPTPLEHSTASQCSEVLVANAS